MLELKWIHTRNMEDNDPQVYLIHFIREDILKYASINPYQYVIRIANDLYEILIDEIRNWDKRILNVKIEPNNDYDNEYMIYKINGYTYPDLNAWWEYLSLEKKANIYLINISGD